MNVSTDNVYVDRWSVLRAVGNLIEPCALPPKPPSKWIALRHAITGAGRALMPPCNAVVVLPPNLELDGEVSLLCRPTLLKLLGRMLEARQPAFVLKGSLERVRKQFRVDPQQTFQLHITRSGLVLLFGTTRGKSVAVHAALDHERRKLIDQLCVGIGIGAEALPDFVPAVIDKDADRITTERIEGRALMPWGASEKTLQAAILIAFEPLRHLHSQRNHACMPDDHYVKALTRFVERHQYRSDLATALHVVEHWNRSGLGSVTVHGDYWLNNVIGSTNRVTGIVDWDRARRNACPAFDALHLGFMSYAMWADKYVSELLASLWTDNWEYPWLSQYAKHIAATFAMSISDLQGAAALLWLSYFYHAADMGPPAAWYGYMIEPVCRALSSTRAAAPLALPLG